MFMRVRDILKTAGTKRNATSTLRITFEYEDIDVLLYGLEAIEVLRAHNVKSTPAIPNQNQCKMVHKIIMDAVSNK